MRIFGAGPVEIIIILVIVLLIFGPKNLPKLGAAVGKGVKNLRDGMGAGKKKKKAENAAAAEGDASSAAVDATATDEVVVEAEELPEADAQPASTDSAEPKKRVVKVVKKQVQ